MMDYSREHLRFLIETCRRNGWSPTETHQFITKAWGEEAITYQSVRRLMLEFESGDRQSLVAVAQSGRPRKMRTESNIEIIRDIIKEFPQSSVEEISESCGISVGSVHRILVQDLHMKSVLSKWVPHALNVIQKQARVQRARDILKFFNRRGVKESIKQRLVVIDEKWIFLRSLGTKKSNRQWIAQGDRQPRIPRRLQHERKTMIIVALCFDGKHCFRLMNPGEAVDGDVYTAFLKQMHHNFSRHQTPLHWRDMILMHDNARPHCKASVIQFLEQKGVTILNQPPYSPDFNILDRYLFKHLENSRRHRHFADNNDINSFLTAELRNISSDTLSYQFTLLKQDLQSITDCGGDYL